MPWPGAVMLAGRVPGLGRHRRTKTRRGAPPCITHTACTISGFDLYYVQVYKEYINYNVLARFQIINYFRFVAFDIYIYIWT